VSLLVTDINESDAGAVFRLSTNFNKVEGKLLCRLLEMREVTADWSDVLSLKYLQVSLGS
jgi:hypothetical protein